MKRPSLQSVRSATLEEKRGLSILALIVAAILFVALNSVSTSVLRGSGIDFTEQNLFTLSDGTRRAIANIDEPITFRLFVSSSLTDRFPQYELYANRVRELLDRYAELSGGKIRLETYDPVPFSDAQDLATSYGLAAIPIDASGNTAYFGLVGINSVDEFEKIPFFHQAREGMIEQDLTRLVVALGPAERPVVGVISGLPLSGSFQMGQGFTPPWPIMNEISTVFEVDNIGTDADEIPENIDVLMIAHPTGIPEQTLYAIDQYVMRGGPVLLFMDPLPETAPRQRTMFGMSPAPEGSRLPRLLEAWGVRMRPNRVAADGRLAMRVDTGRSGPNRIAQYLVWLRMPNEHLQDQLTTEEPTLEGIDSMTFASAGIIDALEDRTTVVTPIVTTTRASMAVEVQGLRMQPDFEALLRDFRPSNTLMVLAARITGDARSAFEGRPAADSEEEEAEGASQEEQAETAEHIGQTQEPLNVMLVADADMLNAQFWRRAESVGEQEITVPTSGNADFVLNALDHLSGANYMLGLRGRGDLGREFSVVSDMIQEADQRYRETRQQLQQEEQETRERLREARSQVEGGEIRLTDEQRALIERFQRELIRIRRELRQIQFNLRADVEALDATLKLINIGAIPILIALIAIGLGIYRHRRRRRRHETN